MLLFIALGIIYLYILVAKERRRNRILTAFVDGLMRYSVKLPHLMNAMMEKRITASELKTHEALYEEIGEAFSQDFWVTPFEKFIKNDRNLFWEEKLANGGFNQSFLDFYDRQLKEWYAIKYNMDETLDNTPELGEKLIYNDFLSGNLSRLKNVKIGKDPRQFFKYLTDEELEKISNILNRR